MDSRAHSFNYAFVFLCICASVCSCQVLVVSPVCRPSNCLSMYLSIHLSIYLSVILKISKMSWLGESARLCFRVMASLTHEAVSPILVNTGNWSSFKPPRLNPCARWPFPSDQKYNRRLCTSKSSWFRLGSFFRLMADNGTQGTRIPCPQVIVEGRSRSTEPALLPWKKERQDGSCPANSSFESALERLPFVLRGEANASGSLSKSIERVSPLPKAWEDAANACCERIASCIQQARIRLVLKSFSLKSLS